jgi:hypothetical protein
MSRPPFVFDGNVALIECQQCGEPHKIPTTLEQITSWLNGTAIQKAMPRLSPADREMFMTGTCDKCWRKMFPEDQTVIVQ